MRSQVDENLYFLRPFQNVDRLIDGSRIRTTHGSLRICASTRAPGCNRRRQWNRWEQNGKPNRVRSLLHSWQQAKQIYWEGMNINWVTAHLNETIAVCLSDTLCNSVLIDWATNPSSDSNTVTSKDTWVQWIEWIRPVTETQPNAYHRPEQNWWLFMRRHYFPYRAENPRIYL